MNSKNFKTKFIVNINITTIFKLLVIIVLVLKPTSSISLDPELPIIVTSPNKSVSTTNINIYFNNINTPVLVNQYFALVIKSFIINFSLLNPETNKPYYNCSLLDLTKQEYVEVSEAPLNTNDYDDYNSNSIAYCQLNQNLIKMNKYMLTITINTSLPDQIKFLNYSFFTASSNTKNKTILQSFVNLETTYRSVIKTATYSESTNNTNSSDSKNIIESTDTILSIQSVTKSIQSSSCYNCNAIYPGNIFSLTINLKTLQYYNNDLYSVKITLPPKITDLSYSQYSTSLAQSTPFPSNNSLFSFNTLSNSNYLNYFNNKNEIYIYSLNNNIEKKSSFSIIINNIIARNTNPGNYGDIQISLLWKNTFSLISKILYQKAFYISTIEISPPINKFTSGVNHPDYWDIYDNSAYPLQFNFSFNNDISEGGYVVLRHSNYNEKGNKRLSFVASTCAFDILNNDSDINNSNYVVCYPLRNDFYYDEVRDYYDNSSNNASYNTMSSNAMGSGIFFKLNRIVSRSDFTLTVWVVIEGCGDKDSLEKYIPKFDIKLYKSINKYSDNEERFSINSSNNNTSEFENNYYSEYSNSILAKGSLSFTGYCHSSSIGDLKNNYYVFNYSSITNDSSEKLLLSEISDFSFGNNTCSSNDNNCILYNTYTDVAKKNYSQFYFNDKNTNTSQSYPENFFLRFNIIGKENSNIVDRIALPYYSNTYKQKQGRLKLRFSSNFFEANSNFYSNSKTSSNNNNSDDCFFSFATKIPLTNIQVLTDVKQNSLLTKSDTSVNNKLNLKEETLTSESSLLSSVSFQYDKLLSYNKNYNSEEYLDSIYFPKTFPIISEIISKEITDSNNPSFSFFSDYTSNKFPSKADTLSFPTDEFNSVYSYLYSSCIKPRKEFHIKSLFSNFMDIRLIWESKLNSSTEFSTIRVIRLVQFYHQLGIFNNNDSITNIEKSSSNSSDVNSTEFLFKLYPHYSFNSENNGISIIEISSEVFGKIKNNEILISLFGACLLETDLDTFEYPIANAKQSLTIKGFSSSFLFSNSPIGDYLANEIYINSLTSSSSSPNQHWNKQSNNYLFNLGSFIHISNVNSAIIGNSNTKLNSSSNSNDSASIFIPINSLLSPNSYQSNFNLYNKLPIISITETFNFLKTNSQTNPSVKVKQIYTFFNTARNNSAYYYFININNEDNNKDFDNEFLPLSDGNAKISIKSNSIKDNYPYLSTAKHYINNNTEKINYQNRKNRDDFTTKISNTSCNLSKDAIGILMFSDNIEIKNNDEVNFNISYENEASEKKNFDLFYFSVKSGIKTHSSYFINKGYVARLSKKNEGLKLTNINGNNNYDDNAYIDSNSNTNISRLSNYSFSSIEISNFFLNENSFVKSNHSDSSNDSSNGNERQFNSLPYLLSFQLLFSNNKLISNYNAQIDSYLIDYNTSNTKEDYLFEFFSDTSKENNYSSDVQSNISFSIKSKFVFKQNSVIKIRLNTFNKHTYCLVKKIYYTNYFEYYDNRDKEGSLPKDFSAYSDFSFSDLSKSFINEVNKYSQKGVVDLSFLDGHECFNNNGVVFCNVDFDNKEKSKNSSNAKTNSNSSSNSFGNNYDNDVGDYSNDSGEFGVFNSANICCFNVLRSFVITEIKVESFSISVENTYFSNSIISSNINTSYNSDNSTIYKNLIIDFDLNYTTYDLDNSYSYIYKLISNLNANLGYFYSSNTNNQIDLTTITTAYPLITELSFNNNNVYNYSENVMNSTVIEGEIASLTLTILFPRNLLPNSKIEIRSPLLSKMKISNINTYCHFSIISDNNETNINEENYLLNTCDLQYINNTNQKTVSKILLSTKSKIKTCSITLNKKLSITIFPVKVINIKASTSSNNDNKDTINNNTNENTDYLYDSFIINMLTSNDTPLSFSNVMQKPVVIRNIILTNTSFADLYSTEKKSGFIFKDIYPLLDNVCSNLYFSIDLSILSITTEVYFVSLYLEKTSFIVEYDSYYSIGKNSRNYKDRNNYDSLFSDNFFVRTTCLINSSEQRCYLVDNDRHFNTLIIELKTPLSELLNKSYNTDISDITNTGNYLIVKGIKTNLFSLSLIQKEIPYQINDYDNKLIYANTISLDPSLRTKIEKISSINAMYSDQTQILVTDLSKLNIEQSVLYLINTAYSNTRVDEKTKINISFFINKSDIYQLPSTLTNPVIFVELSNEASFFFDYLLTQNPNSSNSSNSSNSDSASNLNTSFIDFAISSYFYDYDNELLKENNFKSNIDITTTSLEVLNRKLLKISITQNNQIEGNAETNSSSDTSYLKITDSIHFEISFSCYLLGNGYLNSSQHYFSYLNTTKSQGVNVFLVSNHVNSEFYDKVFRTTSNTKLLLNRELERTILTTKITYNEQTYNGGTSINSSSSSKKDTFYLPDDYNISSLIKHRQYLILYANYLSNPYLPIIYYNKGILFDTTINKHQIIIRKIDIYYDYYSSNYNNSDDYEILSTTYTPKTLLKITPGKYTTYYFYLKKYSVNNKYSSTKITINSSVITTLHDNYYIDTTSYKSTQLLLGTNCYTKIGTYLIKLSLTNSSDFKLEKGVYLAMVMERTGSNKINYFVSLSNNTINESAINNTTIYDNSVLYLFLFSNEMVYKGDTNSFNISVSRSLKDNYSREKEGSGFDSKSVQVELDNPLVEVLCEDVFYSKRLYDDYNYYSNDDASNSNSKNSPFQFKCFYTKIEISSLLNNESFYYNYYDSDSALNTNNKYLYNLILNLSSNNICVDLNNNNWEFKINIEEKNNYLQSIPDYYLDTEINTRYYNNKNNNQIIINNYNKYNYLNYDYTYTNFNKTNLVSKSSESTFTEASLNTIFSESSIQPKKNSFISTKLYFTIIKNPGKKKNAIRLRINPIGFKVKKILYCFLVDSITKIDIIKQKFIIKNDNRNKIYTIIEEFMLENSNNYGNYRFIYEYFNNSKFSETFEWSNLNRNVLSYNVICYSSDIDFSNNDNGLNSISINGNSSDSIAFNLELEENITLERNDNTKNGCVELFFKKEVSYDFTSDLLSLCQNYFTEEEYYNSYNNNYSKEDGKYEHCVTCVAQLNYYNKNSNVLSNNYQSLSEKYYPYSHCNKNSITTGFSYSYLNTTYTKNTTLQIMSSDDSNNRNDTSITICPILKPNCPYNKNNLLTNIQLLKSKLETKAQMINSLNITDTQYVNEYLEIANLVSDTNIDITDIEFIFETFNFKQFSFLVNSKNRYKCFASVNNSTNSSSISYQGIHDCIYFGFCFHFRTTGKLLNYTIDVSGNNIEGIINDGSRNWLMSMWFYCVNDLFDCLAGNKTKIYHFAGMKVDNGTNRNSDSGLSKKNITDDNSKKRFLINN